MTKKANNGVIPLVIESPALKINWANCGVIFDCIKLGTTTGAKTVHFASGVVINKLATAITSSTNKINGMPVKDRLLIKFAPQAKITVPILVLRKIEVNWATKKIMMIKVPISFI